jgi:hypothetical protein
LQPFLIPGTACYLGSCPPTSLGLGNLGQDLFGRSSSHRVWSGWGREAVVTCCVEAGGLSLLLCGDLRSPQSVGSPAFLMPPAPLAHLLSGSLAPRVSALTLLLMGSVTLSLFFSLSGPQFGTGQMKTRTPNIIMCIPKGGPKLCSLSSIPTLFPKWRSHWLVPR